MIYFNTESNTFDNRIFEASITDKIQRKELVEDKELGKGNHSESKGEKKLIGDRYYTMQLSQSLDHAA